jgi:hypothetical protein
MPKKVASYDVIVAKSGIRDVKLDKKIAAQGGSKTVPLRWGPRVNPAINADRFAAPATPPNSPSAKLKPAGSTA